MNNITIILNVWKRNYLKEQLAHIVSQSMQPREIWIIQNESHINVRPVIKAVNTNIKIHHIHSSVNLKYFARFSIANLVKTRYVWIVDDDILPTRGWAEYALSKSLEYNAVICCSGRIIDKGDYRPEEIGPFSNKLMNFIGDVSEKTFCFCEKDQFVDYGIQSYFLRTEWLKAFWRLSPCTFDTGEDIHLAASLQLGSQIKCIVPAQSEDTSGNIKIAYGRDDFASWKMNDFINKRETVLKYLIDQQGWTPIRWQNRQDGQQNR